MPRNERTTWTRALVLCAVLVAGCAGAGSTPDTIAMVSLEVGDLAESGDFVGGARHIEAALRAHAGVFEIRTVLSEERFDVVFDPARVSSEELLETIRGLGFHAQPIVTRVQVPQPPPPAR